ncbi:flagellar hook-basal body complex protein [Mobilicoccus massiliensis]|uniref:flagellar hook-basal body complex protein n=1 Tax=Mobilicoccus massiliensis TaxID=1522310 RepID=UPI00058CDAFF|nr:flagellar hook-basal body complex protein [Mobilicoccus massiliensis]
MIRSMWSAVSGLRNHQIYLDVTGNNIANVNTHGYKSTRAVFEDSLSQVVRNAAAPDGGNGVGGMNPTQIGLGVRLGQISGDFKQGGLQVTNVPTDMAIQGDGFFQIKKGVDTFYTRNGAFSLDKAGDLVTGDGSYVLDVEGEPINISSETYTSWQVAPNGVITGFNADNPQGTTIATLGIAKFNNPNGLERVGGTMFKETLNSGDAIVDQPTAQGLGLVTQGTLEMSNVDLAGEFTNLIMAQRGFQANSKVVTASDEVLQDLINMKR